MTEFAMAGGATQLSFAADIVTDDVRSGNPSS